MTQLDLQALEVSIPFPFELSGIHHQEFTTSIYLRLASLFKCSRLHIRCSGVIVRVMANGKTAFVEAYNALELIT